MLSVINEVSAAYRMLLINEPLILILSVFAMFHMMYSVYSENRSGDSTQPCRTHRLISAHSLSVPFIEIMLSFCVAD